MDPTLQEVLAWLIVGAAVGWLLIWRRRRRTRRPRAAARSQPPGRVHLDVLD